MSTQTPPPSTPLDDPQLAAAVRAFEQGDHAQSRRLLDNVGAVEGEEKLLLARLRRALGFDWMALAVAGGMLALWLVLAWLSQ